MGYDGDGGGEGAELAFGGVEEDGEALLRSDVRGVEGDGGFYNSQLDARGGRVGGVRLGIGQERLELRIRNVGSEGESRWEVFEVTFVESWFK